MLWSALRRTGSVIVATGVVSATTLANREGVLATSAIAASPRSVAQGKVWLLATSGLLADRPALPSIVGLAVVGAACALVCGSRLAWTAAAFGHVGSAILVYAGLDLANLARPGSVDALLRVRDVGTSAVIAAWIGGVAAREWRRRRSPGARLGIVLACCACGLVGWAFRPDLTPLDSEHLVAFAIGALICAGPLATRAPARAPA